jgi:short-subunit dehydrogenase
MKWNGSVALITGASSGIGAELARQAVAAGAHVGLVARREAELERLRAELGDRAAIAVADVGVRAEVATAVKQLTAALGPIDIVVNNAGIGMYDAFLDADVDEIDRLMRTNYLGVVHVLKEVLPGMVERRRGHLVSVSSVAGRIGAPFESAYSATKFAVNGLTEALSVELTPFGIGTSTVNPGPVDTPFFDTRGHRYERSRPKPVPAARVAHAVIRAVESGHREVFVPPLLRQAVVAKTLIPALFGWGTARAFSRELAAERRRT